MKRKKRMMMTIWENMICGEMTTKTTKKTLHQNVTKAIQTQDLRINQGLEVDLDLEIDDDHDILDHDQVPGHLHPAEGVEKIDLMGEGIDRDHPAVAHRRDRDQDIPVEIPEDILLHQGQGGKVR